MVDVDVVHSSLATWEFETQNFLVSFSSQVVWICEFSSRVSKYEKWTHEEAKSESNIFYIFIKSKFSLPGSGCGWNDTKLRIKSVE